MKNTKLVIKIPELVLAGWTIEEIAENKIKVYYINKGRGNSPKPFILPKEVNVDKKFMEAIGMYLGDGKLSKDPTHLAFSSIDVDMSKFILNFFRDNFNVGLSDMTISMRFRKFDEEEFNSWAKNLEIPVSKFKTQNTIRTRNPSCDIQIAGVVFRYIFGRIMEKVMRSTFFNDKVLRRAFLRGLFASEGGIGIQTTENYLAYLAFHLSYEKEEKLANFVQELLELEGITSKHLTRKNKGERYIQITSWENYWKAHKIKLFNLNKRKKDKFMKFLNARKFYCLINDELKSLVLKRKSKRKLSILLNKGYTAIHRRISKNNIEIDDLVKISQINKIPLDILKTNIIGVKTWGSKIIEDKELINFVMEKYLPDKLKDKKTWLP